MAVMNSALQPVTPNRRRRVRHKIQTPAYVTFTAVADGTTLDLHEIVDISEDGVAIQCHSPLEVETQVNLCLDLAECPEHIYTTGQVVWSNASGRAGLHFPELSRESLSRLRQWLFVNVMSGVAHGEAQFADAAEAPRPSYSDTLAAVTAVQRQVEAMGADLAGALRLVAERAQNLVRASGSAIAMTDDDPDFMVCRASAGPDSPPIGARLQVGSGFSGECVKTGKLLRCDDTETDDRVDRDNCRVLGIRSMIAAPVRSRQKTIGILEVFSGQPNTFSASDGQVLQRLAETVLAAVNRAARAEDRARVEAVTPATPLRPSLGSVLFADPVPQEAPAAETSEEKLATAGVSLPRSHLVILICAAAVIFLVLGYNLAPLIQSKLEERSHNPMQTVLASSQPAKAAAPQPSPGSESVSFELMRQMAQSGDPVAENSFGIRYFEGDEKNGIVRDEKQAFHWFSRAAEHGSLAAQAKLGFLYWGGRGVPRDLNQAYFWTAVARARGDREIRDLAAVLTSAMTQSQIAAIDQQAYRWLQQHTAKKPAAGHTPAAAQLQTSITPPPR